MQEICLCLCSLPFLRSLFILWVSHRGEAVRHCILCVMACVAHSGSFPVLPLVWARLPVPEAWEGEAMDKESPFQVSQGCCAPPASSCGLVLLPVGAELFFASCWLLVPPSIPWLVETVPYITSVFTQAPASWCLCVSSPLPGDLRHWM